MTQSSELAQRLLRDYRAGLAPPPGAKATAWATLSATTSVPVGTGTGVVTAAKVLSGIALVVGVGSGALWLSGATDARSGTTSDRDTPDVTIALGASATAELAPTEALVPTPAAPAAAVRHGEPEATAATLTDGSDERPRGRAASEPRVAEATTAPTVGPPAPESGSAPVDEGSPEAPSPSTLAEEVRILRAAEAALASGDPHAALTLLEEHVDRFPAGALARERDVRRVGALCRIGRVADARALAERTVAGHPSLADRLERACPGD